MDKNAIRKYAVWARQELLARVAQRAELFGVTATSLDEKATGANGHVFTKAETSQRLSLINRIKAQGYDATIDEAAYTWFNRFIALRFMEVNGYLPSHVRVFTDETGAFRPQILAEAIHLELPGLDRELVWRLKDSNQTEELYRYLLITQCNALGAVLPGMFGRIADYTELLLPDNLLRGGSVIEQLLTIPEEDWRDRVQIIGWLYQYYNTEPKDKVFANLKKNIKIEAKDIPAATQLFTPDWIVRYMVENSLGRLWLEGHPNPELRASWRYYIDDAEQEPEVRSKLDALCKEEAKLRPQDILCIDPCCGSGHIVVYMFDVLMQIYESQGWTRPDAVRSIIENNLYGLDIDDRAAQLAYFAVMMKAREYDRRFFTRGLSGKWEVGSENVKVRSGKWEVESEMVCDSTNPQTNLNLPTSHSSLPTSVLPTSHSSLPTSISDSNLRGRIEKYVGKELSRAYGMAEVHGAGGDDLPAREVIAERGIVFTFGADAQGGGFDSVKYRRGTSKKLYEGIRELSVDCQGVEGGTGYPAYDLCSPEILDAIASGTCDALVRRGWLDADRVDWQAICLKVRSEEWKVESEIAMGSTEPKTNSKLPTSHFPLPTTEVTSGEWKVESEIAGECTSPQTNLKLPTSHFPLPTSTPQPHVYSIPQTQPLPPDSARLLGDALPLANELIADFSQGKTLGSLIAPSLSAEQLRTLRAAAESALEKCTLNAAAALEKLLAVTDCAEALGRKYHVVVTNPPYMGNGGMGAVLNDYVKQNYPRSKSDMSTVMMEKTLAMLNTNGFMAMINIPVWMFLSSYEKLRINILQNDTYVNMVHPGRGVFGSDFGTTSFVIRKLYIMGYEGSYRRLFDVQGEVKSNEVREQYFLSGKGRYTASQDNFSKIPGTPVSYWVSKAVFSCFENYKRISDVSVPVSGTSTGDNDRFLRCWYEVQFSKIGFNTRNGDPITYKWYPCNKGGEYRKWFGDTQLIIDWENDGYGIKNNRDETGYLKSRPLNLDKIFLPGFSWSKLGSGAFSGRIYPYGWIWESIGCGLLYKSVDIRIIAGLLNSVVGSYLMNIVNPSLGRQPGYIAATPYAPVGNMEERIIALVSNNISLSRADWDAFETSWDFARHPLLSYGCDTIEDAFGLWRQDCDARFARLKANEEELNRIFIDIYGLQDELTPEVDDKDVTVRRADLGRDVRSLLSYFVGCTFGRYSLYEDKVRSGKWEVGSEIVCDNTNPQTDSKLPTSHSSLPTYTPVSDNVIPLTDSDYFPNDVITLLESFLRAAFSPDKLEQNLAFIASALGGAGSPREVIRSYFLNDFFKDHCRVYQKRPIYWLFDSGKKNGFRALVYMHRWRADTIAIIRTDYVHELQGRYSTAIRGIESHLNDATREEESQIEMTPTECVRLTKQLAKLQAQAAELHTYEEKIHHLADMMQDIDLDDGVKVNYAKFSDVLAAIK